VGLIRPVATSPSDRLAVSIALTFSKELSKACSSADEGLVVATGALLGMCSTSARSRT
jgi:hypothetical protein